MGEKAPTEGVSSLLERIRATQLAKLKYDKKMKDVLTLLSVADAAVEALELRYLFFGSSEEIRLVPEDRSKAQYVLNAMCKALQDGFARAISEDGTSYDKADDLSRILFDHILRSATPLVPSPETT
jgi:hypothetical protein